MNPDEVKAAIEALTKGDGKAALTILEALLVSLASGGAAAETPPSGDATAAAAQTPPPAPGEEPPTEEQAKASRELVALANGVIELCGNVTAGEALEAVKLMKIERDKIDAGRKTLEASERRGLVTELVTLGVEVPATAWIDTAAEGAARVPSPRLEAESLEDLRKRVSLIKTSRGIKSPKVGGHEPPVVEAVTLSKTELAGIKRLGITAEEYIARKESAVRRSK